MVKPDCILVPTDFSEGSCKAVSYGVELARTFGATLHLLHVSEEMIFYSPSFGGYMPSRDQYAAYANAGLDNAVDSDQAAQLSLTTEHRIGKPSTEILKCAGEQGASLIVIGANGRSAVRHWILGSVAENVVRHATCPVLTVHGKQHEFAE